MKRISLLALVLLCASIAEAQVTSRTAFRFRKLPTFTVCQAGDVTFDTTTSTFKGCTAVNTPVAFTLGGASVNTTTGVIPYKSGAATFADSPITRTSATILTSTATLRLPDGTAAIPAYSFTSATNTGLYLEGGQIKFSQAGASYIRSYAGVGLVITSATAASGVGFEATAAGGADVNIGRCGAGCAEINSGTAGTLRDLNARTITASTALSGPHTGVATNSNAAAGQVGEFIEGTAAVGAVSLTSTTSKTTTSISLTAGDWDVTGVLTFSTAATTNITSLISSINTTTDTTNGTMGRYVEVSYPSVVHGIGLITHTLPRVRISLAAPADVFLVARGVFTVSTLNAGGNISARRVR